MADDRDDANQDGRGAVTDDDLSDEERECIGDIVRSGFDPALVRRFVVDWGFRREPPENEREAPFNQQVYEALLAQGVDEPMARELAQCEPDTTEIEVGPREGERVLVWPGVPTKKPPTD